MHQRHPFFKFFQRKAERRRKTGRKSSDGAFARAIGWIKQHTPRDAAWQEVAERHLPPGVH